MNIQQFRLFDILDPKRQHNLEEIIRKAEPYYARATWDGWIDHSFVHINNVLNLIHKLIPDPLFDNDCITPDEAFLILASAILHDIGMCPQDNQRQLDYDYYEDLRRNHGARGANIINQHYRNCFSFNPILRNLVCECVINHHGEFNPSNNLDITGFNWIADALLVRLADGLDFGEERAPTHLFEYLKPCTEQKKYWEEHMNLYPVHICDQLFRIRLTGITQYDDFILMLKKNFEGHRSEQEIFFTRGYPDNLPRHYIVMDRTTKEKPGVDNLKESRPTAFYKENYLVAGRILYNNANYIEAKKAFEEGVNQFSPQWYEEPNKYYFYHYLQTHNKLGQYTSTIDILENTPMSEFLVEDAAALHISKGVALFNLNRLTRALKNFRMAAEQYAKQNGQNENLINLADSQIWIAIVLLEMLRNESENRADNLKAFDKAILKAQTLYDRYHAINPDEPETHYKGRFYGINAFYRLLCIEEKQNPEPGDWQKAKDNAAGAYGKNEHENRVPFGVMCGKYCEAAVHYHQLSTLIGESGKEDLIRTGFDALLEVIHNFHQIYRNMEAQPDRMKLKIQQLALNYQAVLDELNNPMLTERLNERDTTHCLETFINDRVPDQPVTLYTPLN